ncbi:BrnT family toxin [Brenneria tiliae]|uniref:BrnT family toxin n=1 Tax=Brenneria tiliae TaxID=2914984 RepID=UPI002014E831|nr:BrnT family toxin [Brenneria tiliae]MCL2898160.1 BrnT family toxin [Brenneria tiliae]
MDIHHILNGIGFEWDEGKAHTNLHKHNVAFEFACEIFFDPNALSVLDNRFDYEEKRYQTIGKAGDQILLLVVHTDRFGSIRLISARKANAKERARYEDDKS